MINFVIWGCGYRGKMLVKCMDKRRIHAFIDKSENLQGGCYDGLPIISFENYLENYTDCFIIISPCMIPSYYDAIISELNRNNIYKYFILFRCPGELPYYEGALPFDEMISGLGALDKGKRLVIAGVNLFAILLYEHLKDKDYNVFLFDYGMQPQFIKLVKEEGYALISNRIETADKVIVTDRFLDVKYKLTDKENVLPFYRFPWLKRYKYSNLKKFHNLHKGERCFVVATGPSLRMADLNKLNEEKEYTISVNTVYKCFGETKWRPNYLVCTDTAALDLYKDEILTAEVKNKFISDRQYKIWGDVDRDDCCLFHSYYEYFEDEGPDFSDDISKGVYRGGSVIYSAIQIAVYLGFKEIYIIGADCEYVGDGASDDSHFIKGYSNKEQEKGMKGELNVKAIFIDYMKALEYSTNHDVMLCNATRGGKLEVLPRIDFDSLFD